MARGALRFSVEELLACGCKSQIERALRRGRGRQGELIELFWIATPGRCFLTQAPNDKEQ